MTRPCCKRRESEKKTTKKKQKKIQHYLVDSLGRCSPTPRSRRKIHKKVYKERMQPSVCERHVSILFFFVSSHKRRNCSPTLIAAVGTNNCHDALATRLNKKLDYCQIEVHCSSIATGFVKSLHYIKSSTNPIDATGALHFIHE